MAKYVGLLKYEFKTLLKNSMSVFMLVYPILILFICGFLIPSIVEKTTDPAAGGATITYLISFVVLLTIGSFLMGAMLGFSLIENKDENTLQNIAVTPITVSGYTAFKVVYTFVISIIANFVMIAGLKLIASDDYLIKVQGIVIRMLDRTCRLQ